MAGEKSGYNLDIQIIPTGIYYSHYWKFNRTLIVNFGDPIPAKEYMEEYKVNPNAATLAIRQKIYNAILPLVLDIRSKKYYSDFENIREIYGRHFIKRKGHKYTALTLFKSDQELVGKLDKLETENPEETEKLVSEVQNYLLEIKKRKLRSWVPEQQQHNFFKIICNKLVLLAGLPVFIYGFLLNAVPFFLIDRAVRKKIKDTSFWSTFFLVAGIILFPVIYLLELAALSPLIPGFWWGLAFLTSLPFAGKLAFNWYILFRKFLGRTRLLLLKLFNKTEFKNLLNKKEQLFEKLDKLISV
jgi:hypothetical protein